MARARFLGVITNPTIAYLLLLAGIFGLVLEALHPGAICPGMAGGDLPAGRPMHCRCCR